MRRFSSVPCDKLCLGSGLVGAPEVYAADGFVCALCVCVLSLELVFPGACRLVFAFVFEFMLRLCVFLCACFFSCFLWVNVFLCVFAFVRRFVRVLFRVYVCL